MNKRSLLLSAFLAVVTVLCVAGTKLSRVTRTRVIQDTSVFLVSTQDVNGRFFTRTITTPDLATNMTEWLNIITTGAVNGLLYDDGNGGGDELLFDN